MTKPIVPATPAPKLTVREKLLAQYNKANETRNKAHAEMEKLSAEINQIDLTSSLTVGHNVLFNTGRAETLKEVLGQIIAERTDESGAKSFKIAFGSGFDADVTVLPANRVKPAPQQAEAAQG